MVPEGWLVVPRDNSLPGREKGRRKPRSITGRKITQLIRHRNRTQKNRVKKTDKHTEVFIKPHGLLA